jgi:F-type H+-transporting ATPase subunit a
MWLKADYVPGLPITTTNLTSLLFLMIILALWVYAKSVVNIFWGKVRTAIVSFVDFTYQFLIDSFDGDREYARAYYPLIMWVFVVIFFGNIFWLIIDWLGFIIPSIHYFARPIFSDLASTLPLALLTVWYSLYISAKLYWPGSVVKWYVFNWTGDSVAEKAVNVFVWWLHIIGIPSSIASLALRLFWNIFAWVVLIAVLAYLWDFATQSFGWVGMLMTIPFWFFELFVAFVQAAVFAMLMIATFKQAHDAH